MRTGMGFQMHHDDQLEDHAPLNRDLRAARIYKLDVTELPSLPFKFPRLSDWQQYSS